MVLASYNILATDNSTLAHRRGVVSEDQDYGAHEPRLCAVIVSVSWGWVGETDVLARGGLLVSSGNWSPSSLHKM